MIADMRDAANVQTCGHQFSGGDDNEGSVSAFLTEIKSSSNIFNSRPTLKAQVELRRESADPATPEDTATRSTTSASPTSHARTAAFAQHSLTRSTHATAHSDTLETTASTWSPLTSPHNSKATVTSSSIATRSPTAATNFRVESPFSSLRVSQTVCCSGTARTRATPSTAKIS